MKATVATASALILTACSVQHQPSAAAQAKPYVIGMGDIMLLNQLHHEKLWFAGTAGNWPLAATKLDELHGGFGRVETYHPAFKKKPTAPAIDEFMSECRWPNSTKR